MSVDTQELQKDSVAFDMNVEPQLGLVSSGTLVACLRNSVVRIKISCSMNYLCRCLGMKCNRQLHVGLQAHRMLKPLISFVFLSKRSQIFKINLKFRLYRTVTFLQVPIFHSNFSC